MRNKRLAGGTGAQARLRAHIRALEARGISVPCARCKAVNVELDVDHITPLWLGGEDVDENVQALCRHTCHRYKTAYEAELRKRVGARLFQVGPDPWRNSSEGPDAA